MKIKLSNILMFLGTFLVVSNLYGCNQSVSLIMEDIKVGFDQGKASFSWKCDDAKEFKIYQGFSRDGEFTLFDTTENNFIENANPYYYYKVIPVKGKNLGEPTILNYSEQVFKNEQIRVFSPYESQSKIQSFIDEKYNVLRGSEFTSERLAMMFLPGNYERVTLKAGYYTSINGLGYQPVDVKFQKLEVKNHPDSKNALINFWRTVENFNLNTDSLWAVSQATSLRRVKINGHLTLSDYQSDGNNFSSGGFIADTMITGNVNSGTQQQWFIRNSSFNDWPFANMNMVYGGVEGKLPVGSYPSVKVTNIDKMDVVKEKPYIMFDETEGYGITIPKTRYNAKGISWNLLAPVEHDFISLDEFYIANDKIDNSSTLNKALNEGKHLLFTPGTYVLDEPLKVKTKNTIIYGLGLATLTPSETNEDSCMIVEDVDNVQIMGLLFDAAKKSDTLLKIGESDKLSNERESLIYLADLYFRVGGAVLTPTSVDTCLEINSHNVLGDNFWIWRADHGVKNNKGESEGVKWNVNYGKNGIIVNGDNVTLNGLMVEHFQEYQTIWNGENGKVLFYQSETPYDAPTQEDWSWGEEEFQQGYASYKINDNVQNHQAIGLGIYFINTIKTAEKILHHAIECPINDNILIKHAVSRYFGGRGYIQNVINDYSGTEEGAESNNRYLISLESGIYQ